MTTALAEPDIEQAEQPPEAPGTMTMVYKYGIPGDLPEAMTKEIWLAHTLRQRLVGLEKVHQARIAAIWADFPDVAEAQKAKDDLEVRSAELQELVKKERQRTRSKKSDPAILADLKEVSKQLKAARQDLRERKARAYAVLKPRMEEAGKIARAEVKALYPQWIEQGMYWATWNDVVAHHMLAVKRIKAERLAGRPADIRYHDFDGTGTITVQLQRSIGDPSRTPAVLASGRGKWANVFGLSPWMPPEQWKAMTHAEQRRGGVSKELWSTLSKEERQPYIGIATFRIGSGDSKQKVQVPVRIHRMMPAEADIAMVRITRHRIGSSFRSTMSITVKVPPAEQRTQGPLAAVHLGWRVLDDGAIRVAVIQGTTTPVPGTLIFPDKYAGPLVRGHGTWSEVIVPVSWRELYKKPSQIRGTRDQNLELLRKWLKEFIEANPGSQEDLCSLAEIGSHRSPRFYSNLANGLRAEYEERTLTETLRPAYDYLTGWQKQDNHLWNWEANERDQLVRRRDYSWEQIAAWLAAEAAVIIVDEWSVASLARAPKIGQESEDGAAQAARAHRVLASPGRLREIIVRTAGMRGARIARPSCSVSSVHHACGTKLAEDSEQELMRWCENCQVMVDQDHNSLQNMLYWARTGRDPSTRDS